MPNPTAERLLTGAMIDGQINGDPRNLYITHDPVAPDIEQRVVVFGDCIEKLPGKGVICRPQNQRVILLCRAPGGIKYGTLHHLDCLGILCLYDTAGLLGIEVVYQRIEGNTKPKDYGNDA